MLDPPFIHALSMLSHDLDINSKDSYGDINGGSSWISGICELSSAGEHVSFFLLVLSVLSVRPGSLRSSDGYSLANHRLYSCINVLMESNKKELVIHPIRWLVIIGRLIKTLKNQPDS